MFHFLYDTKKETFVLQLYLLKRLSSETVLLWRHSLISLYMMLSRLFSIGVDLNCRQD